MDRFNVGIGALLLVAGFVVGGAVGSCTSDYTERDRDRTIANRAHVARYEVNPETGDVEFVYGCTRECCKEAK